MIAWRNLRIDHAGPAFDAVNRNRRTWRELRKVSVGRAGLEPATEGL